MQLKNKVQREEFLDNYHSWELWKEIPELELKFYRHVFPNGTAIVATEYACMKIARYDGHKSIYEKSTSVIYHLILANDDKYKASYSYVINEHKLYNPTGDSKTGIIDYLTKNKPEV